MFNKLKTTTLAALTAAATLIGSGQVWALDMTPGDPLGVGQSPASGDYGPAVGCDGNQTLEVYSNFDGAANGLRLRLSNVLPLIGVQPELAASLTGDLDTPGTFEFLFAYAGLPDHWITEMCPNLSNVQNNTDVLVTTGYAARGDLLASFEATDSNDGKNYIYEFGFEGATNSQPVWRRTCLNCDNTLPTVALSGPATLTGTDPFTVTATFSEDVTGFDDLVNDVTITNGTVTAITGGPAVYTLTITPTGAGDVSITVPAAAAQDAAANDNTASKTLVIGNQIVEITQEAIAGFMLGRANNLASNQPGLTRFLQGDGCGAFSANASAGSGSVNGCVSRGNTWAEISSAWSGEGSYTLGTLGAHSFMNPNLLVGGMVQFDYADDPANNASGQGYMVGPYFVAKAPEQPLYFEGRLLYGQSNNDISPLGTYTDSFETERWLAQLRATGEYKLQNTTLMPLLDVTYTEDNQRAYTDTLDNTIPGQSVDLMQVSAGLDFSTPIPVPMGNLELTGGIKGIYSSTNGRAAALEFENWRGRTHIGLNYDLRNGGTLKFGSFYDGLGSSHESYGANLSFDMKF